MEDNDKLLSIYNKYNSDEYDPTTDSLAYERLVQELTEYRELAEGIIEKEGD